MALSQFETRVIEEILKHPVIYDKCAKNVEDKDDKVNQAYEKVQEQLEEKYSYNVPMAGLQVMYDKISKRMKDSNLQDKKSQDNEEIFKNQESFRSLKDWEDYMKKYGCMNQNSFIIRQERIEQKRGHDGNIKKQSIKSNKSECTPCTKMPFFLKRPVGVNDSDKIFNKFLKESSVHPNLTEKNCDEQLEPVKGLNNFTQLLKKIESNGVTNEKVENQRTTQVLSDAREHDVATIMKSFNNHRSGKSTSLERIDSRCKKFPRLDDFATVKQRLVERMDEQFQQLREMANTSSRLALENNKEDSVYSQLIFEVTSSVNPDDLHKCFEEILEVFEEFNATNNDN